MSIRILVATLVGLSVVGCGESDWVEFSPDDAGFAVLMPSKPKAKVISHPTAIGIVDLNMFSCNEENTDFVVVYSVFPQSHIDTMEVSVMLDRARDGAIAKVQGVLIEESEISLNNHPGRALIVEVPSREVTFHLHFYLVDNRLYQTMIVQENTPQDDTDRIRFFESFRLIDR